MTTLSFAQISDIHISTSGDYGDLLASRAAGFLAAVLADLNQQEDLDFVLMTGDLFDAPTPENVAVFQQIIQSLHKPYYVIPGNHDRSESNDAAGGTHREFAQRYNPQFEARSTVPAAQTGYWSVEVKPGVQLIGLDSIRDEDWGGIIDPIQREWLTGELAAHADKLIILAVHHPLHPLAPIDNHPDWRNFVCSNGPEMLALLDQHPQVNVVLTGHHHQTKADLLGRRLHLACPALAVYPCAYRTLRLTQVAEAWQIEWQTHPATDSVTLAEARERFMRAWFGAGFDLAFVETHAQLAWGTERDRSGTATL